MILFDSNIIIYSARPEMLKLREYFLSHDAIFSDLSRLEVLGYHQLTKDDRTYFEALFSELPVLPVDGEIISRAIEIRRTHRTKTADAIIAATALKMNCALLTADHDDFKKITGMLLIDLKSIV